MLLDEPTGDLDSKTGIEILNLLRDLNHKGATFIAATHDATVTEYTTRVIHIRDGKIVTGLEIAELKETKEMREARQALQLRYKETAEKSILAYVKELLEQNEEQIRLAQLRSKVDEETVANLPMHFDDLVAEMIEKQDLKGKIDSGVLYLAKPENPEE